MRRFAETILRFRVPVIVLTLLITLILGYSLKSLSINSDILSSLAHDDPRVALLNEVGDKFGGSSLAMVALESDDAFSHANLSRVADITRRFKEMDEVASVTSLTDVMDIKKTEWGLEVGKLIDNDAIPQDSAALRRLREYALSKRMYRGNLVSEDGRIAVVAARLRQGADKAATARRMREIVEATQGSKKVYYAGIPFQMVSLTDMIQTDMRKLVPLVVLVVIVVLFLGFWSLRGILLPLSCAALSTIWVLGVMSVLRIPLTIMSNIMPVLLVALGSAYGIHMLSKYNEDARHGEGKFWGLREALSEVGIPILLAGVTTLIGFLTFLSSNLNLIREFGIFTALGVAFAMLLSITFLPAVLSFLKAAPSRPGRKAIGSGWSTRAMDKLAGGVLRNSKLIVVVCAVVVVLSLIMIPRLKREVNMVDYFKKDSEIRQSEEMMENRLGGSIPIQILFRGDWKDPFVLKEMLRLESFLGAQPDVHDPQSVADLVCEMNWVMNGHHTIPETKEGVANLWFFLEGNEALSQLIASGGSEALIQAKVRSLNTKRVQALVNSVEDYIRRELRTDLVAVKLSLASPELAAKLRQERVDRILSAIDMDVARRGLEWNSDSPELQKVMTAAVAADSGGLDEALIDTATSRIGAYLNSEDADFRIESERVVAAVVADISGFLRTGIPGDADVVAILKKAVPRSQYARDPEMLDQAADAMAAIIADEVAWARVNRLIRMLGLFLPSSLDDDEEFLGELRDDVWEINEDWTAIAGSGYASLPGNPEVKDRVELSAQQTGMPIIYLDIDRNLARSQVLSLVVAILLVFLLLAYRLKSAIGGLVSITPIVITVLVNFLIMAVFRIPLDIVTVLLGSIAVGIGIDYTIHFVTRFKVEHAQGRTEFEALDKTLTTTGKAIIINAVSVAMGFLVLVLGSIVPLQRFGYLIALSMMVSAVASITILPSLLLVTRAGFVGRLGALSNGLVSRAADGIRMK